MKNKNSEQHPLFPSGTWNGFYTYYNGPTTDRHEMPSDFHFQEGDISGGGGDDVGPFSWIGSYDLKTLQCRMTKKYARHQVNYKGHVDENGIWGSWNIGGWGGGFHLWPSEEEKSEEEIETAIEELVSGSVYTKESVNNNIPIYTCSFCTVLR